MIKGKITRECEWQKGEFITLEVEFETISELEHYIAYNRMKIKEIAIAGAVGGE